MGYIVKMPKMGLEMEEATLLEWKVDPGDEVEEEQVVAVIETEKAVGDVEAREAGVLREKYIEEGARLPLGTPIGIIAGPDEDISQLEEEIEEYEAKPAEEAEAGQPEATTAEPEPSTKTATADTAVKASPRAKKRAEELGVTLAEVNGSGPGGAITEEDVKDAAEKTKVRASPRAKKRAQELGLELEDIDGTGPQGSITEEDVEQAAEARAERATVGAAESMELPGQTYRVVTRIADSRTANVYLETLQSVRSAFGSEVTGTEILLIVLSETLRKFPIFNGIYREQTHHVLREQNIALWLETSNGIQPAVLRDMGTLSLEDLREARETVIKQTDSDQTSGDPAKDATVSFTHCGELVSEGSTPSILPPAVANLTVNTSGKRSIPADPGVEIRRYLRLQLTIDTRALDQEHGERFLDQYVETLSEASELVLGSFQSSQSNPSY